MKIISKEHRPQTRERAWGKETLLMLWVYLESTTSVCQYLNSKPQQLDYIVRCTRKSHLVRVQAAGDTVLVQGTAPTVQAGGAVVSL